MAMSTTLNEDQALQLAKAFKTAALSVSSFTVEHWAQLSPAERDKLNSLEWSLFNGSEDCINLATILALDDLESVLRDISNATKAATDAVKTINSVKAAISIAASTLTLASAVLSKNPQGIASAVKDLYDEIEKASTNG
jgi:hypothetical protein